MPITLSITFATRRAPIQIYFPGAAAGGVAHRYDYIELVAPSGGSRRMAWGLDNRLSYSVGDGTNLFSHLELLGPSGYVRIYVKSDGSFGFGTSVGTNQKPYIDLKRPDGAYVRISIGDQNQWKFQVL